MAEYRDQVLTGEVAIDANTYINVTFRNAELLYRGGLPPAFDRCSFDGVTFGFREQAGNTIAFLNALAPEHTNLREIVFGVIPNLRE